MKKTRLYLIGEMIFAVALLTLYPFIERASFAEDTITKATTSTSNAPLSDEVVTDPRSAAENFVEHVNYARVALAMKNAETAKQHIAQARKIVGIVKDMTREQFKVTNITSNRMVYQYNTDHQYHYFPIKTGPVEIKKVHRGPTWAKDGLAVTDAEVVYLTVNLTGDRAETYLGKADAAIGEGKLQKAENALAKLISKVVEIDEKFAVPLDKARDNVALTREFITAGNYDGARYALKHADKALHVMEKDAAYKRHRKEIADMRIDVNAFQEVLEKKDPTMTEKIDAKLEKWWSTMKGWGKK